MKGHESNPDPAEREGGAPGDAELRDLEAGIAPVLGQRAGSSEVGATHADADFRADLRAAFATGQFQGDEAPDGALAGALHSWSVPQASPRTRAAALDALLTGAVEESETEIPVRTLVPVPPAPRRLGLFVVGSTLAAAAAVFLVLRTDPGGAGSEPGRGSDPGPGREVAALDEEPMWSLEAEGDLTGFDGLLVDGQVIETLDELSVALASARIVKTGGRALRIRRGDEFVLEIGAGASVDLAPETDSPSTHGRQIFADHGSIRVATGPGFDVSRPLVVRSPHVRSEVTGTVFGIDVKDDYTCVCCLEGEVRTMPILADCEPLDLAEGRTRVLVADGDSREMSIVGHHRGGLVELQERVNWPGYWL